MSCIFILRYNFKNDHYSVRVNMKTQWDNYTVHKATDVGPRAKYVAMVWSLPSNLAIAQVL